MPWIEVIHSGEAELPDDDVRAFAEKARTIVGEVLGTQPGQLRLSVQRVGAAGPGNGTPAGSK